MADRDGRPRRAYAAARALLAREPLLVGLFAAAWVCALVPLWAPRFLPLLDLPNHLDAIAIWHRMGDPSWGYSKFYRLNLRPVPYWGYFLPVHLLSYVMPLEWANKVYLSGYALALPAGALALARQMGRSRWLALFAFPLVFNLNFTFGFITFCGGLALLPWALVLLDRFLAAPTRRRALGLALVTLGLYFTHVLPWMFFGVATVVLAACHGWHPRRIAAAFALELPSLLVAIYGFHAAADGSTVIQPGPLRFAGRREDLLSALRETPLRLISGWSGDTPYYFLLVLSLAWLALLLTARAGADDEPQARGFPYRLELLLALAVLAYIFLPVHLYAPFDLWMIGGRFMTVVALLGALVVQGPIVGWRRWLLMPVAVVALVYPLTLANAWVKFDRRAASFRRLMHLVERGSSTLTLVQLGSDPGADVQAEPYLQFHAYAQLLAGGYDPWALDNGFPFTQRREASLPAPRWKHLDTFSFAEHGVRYDYVLTFAELFDYSFHGPDDQGRAPLIGRDGEWRLYKVRR